MIKPLLNYYQINCPAPTASVLLTSDKVVYDAVQIHGGYGYAREYLVERLYRDSRILGIGGGTTEIMKEIISKVSQF